MHHYTLTLALAATAAFGQRAFDISTVKPNAANDNRVMLNSQPGGRFQATGVTLKLLIADGYGVRDFQILGRAVVDKTDLKGEYDFTLKWTPEPGQGGLFPGLPAGPPSGAEAPPPADTNGPSIFTAIQEQLGLRLESAKGPVEMIVIDG